MDRRPCMLGSKSRGFGRERAPGEGRREIPDTGMCGLRYLCGPDLDPSEIRIRRIT